jgi:opacity protein-like surface antigen
MRRSFVLIISATLILTAHSAWAETKFAGLYYEVDIGVGLIPDLDIDTVQSPTLSGEADWDPGVVGGGAIGYQFNKFLRAEIEVEAGYNNLDSMDLGGVKFNGAGDVVSMSAMGNVLVDLPLNVWIDDSWGSKGVTPYVGLGVGYLYTDIDRGSGSPLIVDDSNSSLAWNALAGVAIEVAPGMEATLNYRYLRSTEKEKFGARLAGIPGSDDWIEVRPESHAFTVGIRYYFTLGVSLR